MAKKYIKISIISSFIGFALAYVFIEYFSYNLKKELYLYEQKKIELQALADSYALCVGLYNANPSQDKEELCTYIKQKVYLELENFEGSYPYSAFYNKFLGK
ncbi:hypothetical protein [Malaciobacter mytili]|uniref:hypothetical protein n=1 Tax=Malaciobacter mytili TaxID=603050 RepID=UPI003A88D519